MAKNFRASFIRRFLLYGIIQFLPLWEVKSVTQFDCHFSVKEAANSSERQVVLKFDAVQDNKNKNRKIVGGDGDTLHLTTEERKCNSFEGSRAVPLLL